MVGKSLVVVSSGMLLMKNGMFIGFLIGVVVFVGVFSFLLVFVFGLIVDFFIIFKWGEWKWWKKVFGKMCWFSWWKNCF